MNNEEEFALGVRFYERRQERLFPFGPLIASARQVRGALSQGGEDKLLLVVWAQSLPNNEAMNFSAVLFVGRIGCFCGWGDCASL